MKPAVWNFFVTKGRRRRVQISRTAVLAAATTIAGVAAFVTVFPRHRRRSARRPPFFAVV